MSTPKKRSILQPSMTLKLPRRRAAAIGTSGIRVYRGGVTSAKWKLVSQRPKVQKINDTISIRANIAVNKGAERQSEMMVEISSEALLDLFETQFEVKGKGVGELIMSLRKARRAASTLMEAIDNIRLGFLGLVDIHLRNVPPEPASFDYAESLEQLKAAQNHNWENTE